VHLSLIGIELYEYVRYQINSIPALSCYCRSFDPDSSFTHVRRIISHCFYCEHFKHIRYLFCSTLFDLPKAQSLSFPSNNPPSLSLSNDYLKSKYSLLLTIHPNPGPSSSMASQNDNINLFTYNVNGLGNECKTKLLINKLIKHNKSHSPTVIALQETHLSYDNIRSFNNKWRFQAVHSCYNTASAGVTILFFEHQWAEKVDESTDTEGRVCSVVLKTHSGIKFAFLSVYVPSCSSRSAQFIDSLEVYCMNLLGDHPDAKLVLLGDFNYTSDHNDYTTLPQLKPCYVLRLVHLLILLNYMIPIDRCIKLVDTRGDIKTCLKLGRESIEFSPLLKFLLMKQLLSLIFINQTTRFS